MTADRALARRAREAGAKVSAPEEFFGRFGRTAPGSGTDAPGAKVDVEEWTRYFEDESNRD